MIAITRDNTASCKFAWYKLTKNSTDDSQETWAQRLDTLMVTLMLVSLLLLFSARSALSSLYSSRPWDTFKYCNAPHVNASHYQPAKEGAKLVHLTVLMRHHKVTYWLPIMSCQTAGRTENTQRTPAILAPNEREINDGIKWDCSDVQQFTYDGGGARLSNSVVIPPGHPFARQIWAGSCEEGQLTAGGLKDSKIHGKVRRC